MYSVDQNILCIHAFLLLIHKYNCRNHGKYIRMVVNYNMCSLYRIFNGFIRPNVLMFPHKAYNSCLLQLFYTSYAKRCDDLSTQTPGNIPTAMNYNMLENGVKSK